MIHMFINPRFLAKARELLLVFSLIVLGSFMTVGVVGSSTVGAICSTNDMSVESGAECAKGNGQPTNLFSGETSVFGRITSILLFIVGAIAVIMLIIGGIRYVVSGGDQNQVTAAKNTILYAIIGIVVAMLAYAAVRFVTTSLLGSATQ